MPMVADALAKEIADALKSKEGPTKQIKGTAKALITAMKAAIFSHLLVNGSCGPGGPISAGAAEGGIIVMPTAAAIPIEIAAALEGPPTPQIIGLALGFSTHVMTGLVSFKPGGITGTCANSPVSPGPVIGAGQNGQIMGLSGPALASAWAATLGGKSEEIDKMAEAVAGYFSKEAMGSYMMGSVTGVAPPGGGPIVAVGVGGTFS
jgi:hypothetical protein